MGSFSAAQRYSFTQISSGLGDLNVNALAQDRTGYLWVGTENGLYRYDGDEFQEFGPSSGMHARLIQSLFLSPDGTLFVGTNAGIYFKGSDHRFHEVQPPDAGYQFSQRVGTVFTANAAGTVAAADRRGAYQLHRTAVDQWAVRPLKLGVAPVWGVLYGLNGSLWFGCGEDLCRNLDGRTTHLGAGLHLPADRWIHLLQTRDGHIWIRGQAHLGEIIPAENRYIPHDLPGSLHAVPYGGLVEDAKGRVTASQGPNLAIWERDHWRMVTSANGVPHHDISCLFLDRDKALWLGLVGHGLSRWLGQDQWEAYTSDDGLSDDIVWAAQRDRSGRLWIGTESGLNWVIPGSGRVQLWKHAGIDTSRADAFAEGPDGSLWVGSAAGRLIRIDEKTLKAQSWSVPEVYRILLGKDGRLWIATSRGLYVSNTRSADPTPRLVEDATLPKGTAIFSDLAWDPQGQLWAASEGGLYRLGKTGWQHIDTNLTGAPNLIAVDRHGELWVGGQFPGLLHLRVAGDRAMILESIAQPRLLSGQIVSLLIDSRGWLWVGQDAGLTLFNGSKWRSFTQDDGLVWDDLDENALYEDPDGSVWIGTSGGLAHLVHPGEIPQESLVAPAIAAMSFGAVRVDAGDSLLWKAVPLSITMAPLTFSDAHRIHLRYRLLGLETDWVDTEDSTVRYPRLDPGDYRFEVMAVDAPGGKISPMTVIAFTVAPRWWQTWELRLVLLLLGGLGIVLVWRWRSRVLLNRTRQLEAAVRQRTESLEQEKEQLMHTREQMRHHAEHDDLTGLWNHRIIVERLRGEVDRAQREGVPLSVILTDLDHFKRINDTYGHLAGDNVLREVANIFQNAVRSYDWVGRYGGEEFLLILPGTSFVHARLRAEQLRQAVLSARIADDGTPIQVTASFGVASGFSTDYEDIIRCADEALYRAKANGRNCVVATELDAPSRQGD